MLKYSPREFYAYAHAQPHSHAALPPETFATYLGTLFHDQTAPPDAAPPTPLESFEPFKAA